MHASKGRSVVAADGLRQARALKEPLKALSYRFGSGVIHRAQFQDIASMFIPDGERLAPFAVASPPPFKIHRPYLVRCSPMPSAAQATRFSRAAPPPLLGQPRSFQHPFNRTLARHLSMPPPIQLANLTWPP